MSGKVLQEIMNLGVKVRMRKEWILLLLVGVLIIGITVYTFGKYQNDGFTSDSSNQKPVLSAREGFETISEKVQDRANPLAADVHPLNNPSANYGISETSGHDLRDMTYAALNIPLEQRTAGQDLTQANEIVRLSPRIDNTNSYLGLVKFCKEKAQQLDNPFTDPDFKKFCGMCMSSGQYVTGETFNSLANGGKGAGVLVYEEDKIRAYTKQDRNNYKYPRAIPSLDAAQCQGASLSDDSTVPVLAINSKMYYDMKKRNECQNNKSFTTDHTCGRCVTTGSEDIWSFVKNPDGPQNTTFDPSTPFPTSASINPIFLDLYGIGQVLVTVGGRTIYDNQSHPITEYQTLSTDTPVTWNLAQTQGHMYAKEGEQFIISVKAPANGVVYVGGILRGSAPPAGVVSKIQLANVYQHEDGTGTRLGRGPTLYTQTDEITTFQPNSIGTTTTLEEKMKMVCFIPLTFLASSWDNDHPQIAFYDCKNNPYVTQELSDIFLTDDVCARDKKLMTSGSITAYSQECLQKLLSDAGCSSAGTWWRNTTTLTQDAGSSTDSLNIRTYLANKVPTAPTDTSINEKCFGIVEEDPCKAYLDDPTHNPVPNQACLSALYRNTIVNNGNRRTSSAYQVSPGIESFTDYVKNYRSLNKNTDEYCREGGSLNPNTTDGYNRLKLIAEGTYKGYTGVDAVKHFLQDTYTKAIDQTKDIHVMDASGGRADSWRMCFGIPLAPPKRVTVNATAPAGILNGNQSINYACPFTNGYPVYVDANAIVGSSNTNQHPAWRTNDTYIRNAPPSDIKCYWIWGEPDYLNRATGGKTYTFRFNYCSTFGYDITDAKIIGGLDDSGTVKVNGTQIHSGGAAFGPFTITLNGNAPTPIEVTCTNGGTSVNPAGIWIAIYKGSGTTKEWLAVTNEQWTFA